MLFILAINLKNYFAWNPLLKIPWNFIIYFEDNLFFDNEIHAKHVSSIYILLSELHIILSNKVNNTIKIYNKFTIFLINIPSHIHIKKKKKLISFIMQSTLVYVIIYFLLVNMHHMEMLLGFFFFFFFYKGKN